MSNAAVIAKNLKLLRKINKITQQDLSSKLDLNYRHYQSIEAGRVDLKLSTLERLAEYFGIPLQCFFGPALSMKSLDIELFDFPKFLVQVCDAKNLKFLKWCRGSKIASSDNLFDDSTPVSFAYPVQEGRKKADIILPQFFNKALERGECHFTWRACVNVDGMFCIPSEADQISTFDILSVGVKSDRIDLIVTFIPKNFTYTPVPSR